MLFRLVSTITMLLLLTLPASGLNLYPLPDEALQKASARFRDKDYKGAREAALLAPNSAVRDFMLGMAATRLEQWQDAADYLARAADGFPLLADYSLYHQARALSKLGRYGESLALQQRALKNYPDSPLVRGAALLLGDTLFGSGDFKAALAAFDEFINKYPAGADSLAALHKSALCREQLGDSAGAVTVLRAIRQNYPASTVAVNARDDLERLARKGFIVAPFSPAEIFQQGTILFDLGKYEQALKTFNSVPQEAGNDEFLTRLQFKTGQALYKARRYRDAEPVFRGLLTKNLKRETSDEVHIWLARTLAKNGKDEDAFTTYLKLAEASPKASLADNALLEAALIRKSQKKWDAALPLLQKSLLLYPNSNQLRSVIWEIAWGSYQSRNFKEAAEYFHKLTSHGSMREKALYWYGRSLLAAGDTNKAQEAFSSLISEFPLGYYALTYKKEADIKEVETSLPPKDLAESLAIPAGFERAKALITLGLHEEAVKELSAQKKHKQLQGIARLYLEMENYNGAINLFRQERLRTLENGTAVLWGINYPLAFREYVTKSAAANGLPESLVYSIIRAESTFSPTALSPAGAVGLMQLMPATAAAIDKGGSASFDSNRLTRPELNIRFGAKHLKDLLVLHNGNPVLVIASYNAGSGNVNRWKKNLGDLPRDEFIESIPFAETREYVKKVLAGIAIYERLYNLGEKAFGKTAPGSPPKSPPV
jgi:soluble lytic murein transglycosylase